MNLCYIEKFCRSSDSEVLWFPLRGRTLAPEITIPPGGCSRETRQTRVTAVGTILQGDTADCCTLFIMFRLQPRPSCTLHTETASTSAAWRWQSCLSADISITQHQSCCSWVGLAWTPPDLFLKWGMAACKVEVPSLQAQVWGGKGGFTLAWPSCTMVTDDRYSAIMLSINYVRAADGGCSRARFHSDWQNCRISPAAHCHIAAAPPRPRHNILSDVATLPLRLIATPATAPWIHLCLTFISPTTF